MLTGFGNYHQSESITDTILPAQNSPQVVPHGLYAEQISGSAFTMHRHLNYSTWMYRILPSVKHQPFEILKQPYLKTAPLDNYISPEQRRWSALPQATDNLDLISSLKTLSVCGNARDRKGGALHLYAANQAMQNYFYNADGELLFIPYEGELLIKTELGQLRVKPTEVAVVPRGIKFQIEIRDHARGYLAENYGHPFKLPELGVLGAHALARPRDFIYPTANFEDKTGNFNLVAKFDGQLWQTQIDHSPLNVVAWHGNYAPYKYDLKLFNTINTVSFDHPDPSIFTVLHAPSSVPNQANLDFVIFPPRWMVATETFRPPYFHRNMMNELMGLIQGQYDAKPNGFEVGGVSLHNCMSAHGPDNQAYQSATNKKLMPEFYDNTLAFMLESFDLWQPTEFALNSELLQKDYLTCWENLAKNFNALDINP